MTRRRSRSRDESQTHEFCVLVTCIRPGQARPSCSASALLCSARHAYFCKRLPLIVVSVLPTSHRHPPNLPLTLTGTSKSFLPDATEISARPNLHLPFADDHQAKLLPHVLMYLLWRYHAAARMENGKSTYPTRTTRLFSSSLSQISQQEGASRPCLSLARRTCIMQSRIDASSAFPIP